jgi:hypothetical protein
MELENDVINSGNSSTLVITKGPEFEKCSCCGEMSYVRCGAVGQCYDELCPSNVRKINYNL